MTRRTLMVQIATAVSMAAMGGEAPGHAQAGASLQDKAKQVADTERAFAKTMADRDHAAFTSHLAEEAVFFSANPALRGRVAVSAGWKRFYDAPSAPFSWEPDRVEVLDSGALAFSTGPVRNPEGRRTGTFMSVWRLEADGKWRIVFDNGCPPCDCK